MANIPKLIEHLSSRPIAPIFGRLDENEKNDENALKFMCVVDYEMSKKRVYDRIAALIRATNYPKLLNELLGFNSYKSFRYFEYHGNQHFDGKYLRCQSAPCEFVGPYMLTLTHMAINHNAHHGTKICLYCKKFELKMHNTTDSFGKCYKNYRDEEEIPHVFIESTGVNEVISEFYAVLKDCSKSLDVYTQRHLYGFVGKLYNQKESLVGNYGGDIAPEITIGATRGTPKPIPIGKLNKVFEKVMIHYYGGNVSRFYVVSLNKYIFFYYECPNNSVSDRLLFVCLFLQSSPKVHILKMRRVQNILLKMNSSQEQVTANRAEQGKLDVYPA